MRSCNFRKIKSSVPIRTFIALVVISVLFSGCALELAEALSVEDAALVGGATESELAAFTAEETAVFEDIPTTSGSLNERLANVRLLETPGEKPTLYINTKNGIKKIAEIENANTIRILRNGEYKNLPGEFYKVKAKQVNVRSSRILDSKIYNIKYKAEEEQLVLVLSEREGWYTVWLGENKVGYIKDGMGLLKAVALTTSFSPHSSEVICQTCNTCNGYGSVYGHYTCPVCNGDSRLKCSSCHGDTRFMCTNCSGKTRFVCSNCHGDTRFVCSNCHGATQFTCNSCAGKGRVKCAACKGKRVTLTLNGIELCYNCNGTGKSPCYTCNQTGIIPCYTCNQSGYIPCYTCNQTGLIPCYTCNQTGFIPCYTCNQTGYLACYTCNQTGKIDRQVLCNVCLGTGRVVANQKVR